MGSLRWLLRCASPEQTADVGEALGRRLEAGDVVTLSGPLGSGKTTFVKGLARGLGAAPEAVTSPTFIYVREVRGGRLPLFHVDAYRLTGRPSEFSRALFEELGLDHYLQAGGVVAVEWPQPLAGMLGAERVEVELQLPLPQTDEPSVRRLYLRGLGERLAARVREVALAFGGTPAEPAAADAAAADPAEANPADADATRADAPWAADARPEGLGG